MKLAIDVGGVLSKHPDIFRPLIEELDGSARVEVFVLSDMHPHERIQEMLRLNGIYLPDERVVSADYAAHGESCKAVACERLGIDLLIDDFPGYVGTPGKPRARLLVMPDPSEPYYHDSWATDGTEGNFGRRRKP